MHVLQGSSSFLSEKKRSCHFPITNIVSLSIAAHYELMMYQTGTTSEHNHILLFTVTFSLTFTDKIEQNDKNSLIHKTQLVLNSCI